MFYNGAMKTDIRISLRITGKLAQRYKAVWERVLSRTMGEAHTTNFIYEMMGFRPLKLISAEERKYLSGLIDMLPEGQDCGPFSANEAPGPQVARPLKKVSGKRKR